jgi:hypothetical protein
VLPNATVPARTKADLADVELSTGFLDPAIGENTGRRLRLPT